MKLNVCAVAALICEALICAPAASAEPPNFPDFTGFAVVTDAHGGLYQRGSQTIVAFSTPDGVRCGIHPLAGIGNSVRCYGSVPGLQGLGLSLDRSVENPCDFGEATLRAANPGALKLVRGTCPTELADVAPMAVGQQVRVGTTTCGVAAGDVTACIDKTGGGHGFVLQPSGSWSF